MGLLNPTLSADWEYMALREVTGPLSKCLINQGQNYSEAEAAQLSAKRNIHLRKWQSPSDSATELHDNFPANLKYAMDLAQERGASNWLTALPIEEHGFLLHKGTFRDAVALRYG